MIFRDTLSHPVHTPRQILEPFFPASIVNSCSGRWPIRALLQSSRLLYLPRERFSRVCTWRGTLSRMSWSWRIWFKHVRVLGWDPRATIFRFISIRLLALSITALCLAQSTELVTAKLSHRVHLDARIVRVILLRFATHHFLQSTHMVRCVTFPLHLNVVQGFSQHILHILTVLPHILCMSLFRILRVRNHKCCIRFRSITLSRPIALLKLDGISGEQLNWSPPENTPICAHCVLIYPTKQWCK